MMQGQSNAKEIPLFHSQKALAKHYSFPLIILLIGVLFSLYLQWQLPDGVFFSGDAGLKALLSQQLSAGQLRFDLAVPAETWIQNLWQKGLYPFQEPFVYNRGNGYYITFPFTFPLITAPFHALFGFRGLYLVPLIATWATWVSFYFACHRLKLKSSSIALALATLIFASPLTIYSAMYWEHTLAVALSFYGIATLLIPGSQGLSKKDAVLSGISIGLSVWFREEILGLVAIFCVLVYAASFLKLKKLQSLGQRKELFVGSMLATIALFFVFNTLIYHHPLGMHSVQIVEKFSLTDRFFQGLDNLKQMGSDLFYYFPITFFTVLYLGLNLFKPETIKLPLKMKVVYLMCFLFVLAVAVMVPPGAGGKQWGSRFLLVLIPLISLIGILELRFIRRVSKFGLQKIGAAIFSVLFLIGVYINTVSATTFFIANNQNITPAISVLRSQPEKFVAMSHQYVGQVLEPSVRDKVFFLADDTQDLVTLSKALLEQGNKQFVYICYSEHLCPPKELSDSLKFPLNNQTFALNFSPIREEKIGRYFIYQASISEG